MMTDTVHKTPLMRRKVKSVVLSVVAAALTMGTLLLGQGAPPAHAGAFPGTNGKIVFSSYRNNNWDVYSMNPDGSGLKRLTKDPAGDVAPAVSPDGKKIAFSSERSGNWEIYTMDSDGSNLKRLTYNAAFDYDPTFSPDGKKLAWESDRATGDDNIWVMDADGGPLPPVMLTSDPGGDSEPAFSPDGTKMAFMSSRSGNLDIYTMSATSPENDTANAPKRLTNGPALQEHEDPSFSPDGKKIAFYSWGDDSAGIYVMNADGSNKKRLTNNPSASDAYPAFSPDGKKIAFMRQYEGLRYIYKMNSDGSNKQKLYSGPIDTTPDWGVKPY